ncbi:Vegetative incompatibility protein HET-E-1 [Colletotrichum fructicola]|nr:Vegetative incompatibility protein HET-E-1 [Colletotrichum fructicola]KAF4939140.1 Vegetative incompatibility protein HET-E-1 [Colletotrichum fructicola]
MPKTSREEAVSDMEDTSADAFTRAVEGFLGRLSKKLATDHKNPFLTELKRLYDSVKSNPTACDGESFTQQATQSLKQSMDTLEGKHKSTRFRHFMSAIAPFMRKVEPVIKVLEPLGSAGPMGTGIIFSGARLVLEMAVGYQDYFDELLSALCIIADNLRVYELRSQDFRDKPDFQSRLVSCYKRILEFWYSVSETLRDARKASLKALHPDRSDDIVAAKGRFREDMDSLNDLAKAYESKRSDENYEREKMDRIRKWLAGGQAVGSEPTRIPLHNGQARHPGTCEWILQNSRFMEWRDSKHKSVLWYNAPPGSGKSVLASAIIDHLRERGEKVAYFFFSFSDNHRKRGINAFRSLIIQLLCALSSHVSETFISTCWKEMENDPQALASEEVAAKLINELFTHNNFFVVIDGLDECINMDLPSTSPHTMRETREPYDALKNLKHMVGKSQTPFVGGRWLFTSRKHYLGIDQTMKDIAAVEIQAEPSVIARDVQMYLNANTPNIHWADDYPGADESFLYARLLCYALSRKKDASPSDIKDDLQRFTGDLNGYFNRSLVKIAEHEDDKQEFAQRLFLLLVTAEQSLTVTAVIDALSVDYRAREYNRRRREKQGEELIRELCGPLVDLDPVVRFCHKSVRDYLKQDPEGNTKIDKSIRKFFVPGSQKANSHLGMDCLAYLVHNSYNEFQSLDFLLGNKAEGHSFLRYAATFWFQHLYDVDPTPTIRERVVAFLKSKAFWTCLFVQSRVAPFLFGYYSQNRSGSFRMGIKGHQYVGDDSFGVPLPAWLIDHSEDLDQSFCCFIMEWRETLTSCSDGLKYCFPLRRFSKANSCHLTPLAKAEGSRLRVIHLEEFLAVESITTVYAFDLDVKKNRPVVNLFFRNKSDTAAEIWQFKAQLHSKPKGTDIALTPHKVPVTENSDSLIYFIVNGAGHVEMWYLHSTTLQVGPVVSEPRVESAPSMLPVRSQRQQHMPTWNIVGSRTICSPSDSSIRVVCLDLSRCDVDSKFDGFESEDDDGRSDTSSSASDSTSDEEYSSSDDHSSDQDSAIEVVTNVDRVGSHCDTRGDILSDQPTTTRIQEKDTKCMVFIRSGKPSMNPIYVSWTSISCHWDRVVDTIHPTLPLIVLTHSPTELKVIDVSTDGRPETIHLPSSEHETDGNQAAQSRGTTTYARADLSIPSANW